MPNFLNKFNNMNSDELDKAIESDKGGDLQFQMEAELMGRVGAICFPDSETFGDSEEENDAERCIRVLIESLGFPETLNAVNAIDNEFEELVFEEADDEGEDQGEDEDAGKDDDNQSKKKQRYGDEDEDAGFYDDL